MSATGPDDHEGARAADSRTSESRNRTESGEHSAGSVEPKLLPLNSRRLTVRVLRQLARELGLPGSASASDVRPLIEGALNDLNREPRNVQVLLLEAEAGITVSLQDEDGVFLTAGPREAESRPETPDPEIESHSGEETLTAEVQSLRLALQTATAEESTLRAQVSALTAQLENEKKRTKDLWRLNCAQLAEFDSTLARKDDEMEALRGTPVEGQFRAVTPVEAATPAHSPSLRAPGSVSRRRGKAPPVDAFTGEDREIWLEDWLPSLKRAAKWNAWEPAELLLQLAGHLRGRALQEYNLLDPSATSTFDDVVETLRSRLDPGGKALAAQDFRHASQRKDESISDFILRLERVFQVAYGRDGMLPQTRDALLYSQLQEGLRHSLMEAPAVSGAASYASLRLAAKNEERRQAALRSRKGYQWPLGPSAPTRKEREIVRPGDSPPRANTGRAPDPSPHFAVESDTRKCYLCGKAGHLAKECRSAKKTESRGRPGTDVKQARMVQAPGETRGVGVRPGPLHFLYSSSDEEDDSDPEVHQVRVMDEGSRAHCARVELQGVPVYGIVDSAADITIIGGALFKRIATIARLRKRDFKPPDKTPKTYDQKSFKLDGRMDLDISFGDQTMCTPVYVKMDAHDQLLLSEGVCRQLGIITYHSEVETWQGRRKRTSKRQSGLAARPLDDLESVTRQPCVPTVRVTLVQAVKLDPQHRVTVKAHLTPHHAYETPVLIEGDPGLKKLTGLVIDDALVQPTESGEVEVVLTNATASPQVAGKDTDLGVATTVSLVGPDTPLEEDAELRSAAYLLLEEFEATPTSELGSHSPGYHDPVTVRRVTAKCSVQERQQKLLQSLPQVQTLDPAQTHRLHDLLTSHHEAFCLDRTERGETDLLQFSIDTGDARPRKLPARRMPLAVRDEVARQLREMQQAGVVQPSSSPWSSPVVMVRKKDGTHRFCVDYRHLNAVTKPDSFPLPRIDDLLDQLGKARYFSTLDLASGYWQIRVHPGSQEKTAFVTPQGLFEFRVMPFGLTNAPAVFQRLMQRVLMDLNPAAGPDWVVVYIDDVLVFSRTLEEHLHHLQRVITRLQEVGLKLKPAKCHFARDQVEYLGHLITPNGLKPNPKLVAAVREFPTPQDLKTVRQFLGLSSYYRRFIRGYAAIARPLHRLTRKDTEFVWTEECEAAVDELRTKLTTAPVLAYPALDHDFVLETDASIKGLGAVLSQKQSDGLLHPVAYASRSLSGPEANYGITELETLAVVWAITYFHHYLYGRNVTVLTDHSAVKAVLETPNPSGKHARWWTRVYGTGVKTVQIVHRSGKSNASADALSRSPQAMAPQEGIAEGEVQVAEVSASDIQSLLSAAPGQESEANSFVHEQHRDPELKSLALFLETGELPPEDAPARKIALQSSLFVLVDAILYFVDPKQDQRRRAAVPSHMREQLIDEAHRGLTGGHFSGPRVFRALSRHWWWEGMYGTVLQQVKCCPECAIVSGGGKVALPPLHPIPVQRPFQILAVDVMDLPATSQGNKHVIVFQDYLTKWPMVYAIPDQKAHRIARLLVEEIIPFFGVPEALLSDRGANLLSHLMRDVCTLLGIKKLNTTAYHPQCNGMVERFNRTLKTMLRKHAARFGLQWDRYLSGVLWAYRNTPHDSTGEKPSFLLFGMDLRTPTEAAILPPTPLEPGNVEDYREELILNLSTARQLAVASLKRSQQRAKTWYDRTKSMTKSVRVGEWVLIRFPHEETGKTRKLSQPWHGPYRVVSYEEPDVTARKVYGPQDPIQVHRSRVTTCPDDLPPGYYWYGRKRNSAGKPPQWVEEVSAGTPADLNTAEPTAAPQEPTAGRDHASPATDRTTDEQDVTTFGTETPAAVESASSSHERYPRRKRVQPQRFL